MKTFIQLAVLAVLAVIPTQASALPISNFVTTGEAFNGGTQDTYYPAIAGQNSASSGDGAGVYGASTAGDGTYGTTAGTNVAGVHGHTSTANGWGVHGDASGSGTAVYGDNTSGSGWSGYFSGRVNMASLWFSGTCYAPGSVCSSDARLKKNVQPLTGSLDKLAKLRPVTFEWKEPAVHGAGVQKGFIAQDVEAVLPEWVGVDDHGFKTLERKGLDVMLVESIQTLKADNDELRARVKSLETRRTGWGTAGISLGLLGMVGMLVMVARKRS